MSTKYKLKKLWGGEQFCGYRCADECTHLNTKHERCDLYRERVTPSMNPESDNFGKFGRCADCLQNYEPKDEDEVTEE